MGREEGIAHYQLLIAHTNLQAEATVALGPSASARPVRCGHIESGTLCAARLNGCMVGDSMLMAGRLNLYFASGLCEEAFAGRAGASYVCFDYRLRPSRRADC